MKSDTVRLCGHHLLCILTYIGRGYTSEFTENMTAVISRINQGAEIQIVSGPDDICTPMLNDVSHHCSSNDVAERDAVALITVSIALSRHVRVGDALYLSGDDIQILHRTFVQNPSVHHRNHCDICVPFRAACHECPWEEACTEIANEGFNGKILSIPVVSI
jgi:hypothetical protein